SRRTVAPALCSFFFSHDTSPTAIYTLSLHDALPISRSSAVGNCWPRGTSTGWSAPATPARSSPGACGPASSSGASTGPEELAGRSEEHTSELQSPYDLVCRLLLEKKKTKNTQ